MTRHCTILSERGTPSKLIKLVEHFAWMMLKKGFKFRVGDDEMSDACMTAACNEGQFFAVDSPPWMLCESIDTAHVNERAAHVSENVELEKKKVGVALMTGLQVAKPSSVTLIWTMDGAKSPSTITEKTPEVVQVVIAQAIKYKIPLLNLARPEHLAKAVKMVKEFNKKSAVQKMAQKFKR